MNIFAGTVMKGYFVEETCNARQLEFAYAEENPDIRQQTEQILQYETVEYVVYDVSQYTNSPSEIADSILLVQKAKNAKTVILASGFSKESSLIAILRKVGINAFIFSLGVGSRTKEFQNFLDDYYKYTEIQLEEMGDVPEIPEELPEHPKEEPPHYVRSIAFTGTMNRIGVTTQALQMAKLYQTMGLKPCYIAMNESDFVENIGLYYSESETDKDSGKVSYGGIDMFYDLDKICEILSMDYDCYIYDFGVFGSNYFNRGSFLEKELTFIVCGCKPDELPYTNKILENAFYKNVKYIFSFVAQAEQKDILELMEDLSSQTYFSGYVPDPFSFSESSSFFTELIGAEKKDTKKSGLLGGFFKKGIRRRR